MRHRKSSSDKWRSRKMVSTDSTWTKLCTYTTVKKCQIVDAKIALSHKAVMLGVLTYIVVNLILSHGYMKQEAPSAVVNAYVDEADYYAYVSMLASDPPAYCDNPDTDYTYSASWTYEDNGCDFSLRLGDVLTKTESAVFITTYFQDTPVDAASANAAGMYASNAFVPGVDQMRLVFDHQVSTTWGDVVGNPAIEFRRTGEAAASTEARLTSPAKSDVGIPLADLLSIAGADLDATNAGSNGSGPLFRLSGTHVKINVAYDNMHSTRPFDYETKAFADVSHTTGGVWTSLGPKMVWKADATGTLHQFQRYHYALRVSFVFGGTVGVFDFFTLLINLAVAMGMLGVAVTVVDAASEYLVSNFDDQKYDDRNDFMTLEALKEYALEQGILDRYAAKTGMELLDDDVMRAIRERSKKNSVSLAKGKVADETWASERRVQGDLEAGVRASPAKRPVRRGAGDAETAAEKLAREQAEFLAALKK
jgi:hypothetical protein